MGHPMIAIARLEPKAQMINNSNQLSLDELKSKHIKLK